ncbi:HEAT repeat domain-containing protein [Streptomyces sp. B8F3]|uniref:HEAT repeat domain-containing protein n=1 Tax=unclassified Streptomyces TaxID=2593676 RepID=UPI00325DCBDE
MTEMNEPPTAGRRLTQAEKQAVINSPEALAAKARDPYVVKRRQLYAESAAGVLADLAECGFPVGSVGELRRGAVKYQAAVPVLVDWLSRISYLPLVEDIVRALSVPFAKKQVLPIFLQLFRVPPRVEDPMRPKDSEPGEEHIRWVIGNGLFVFAGPSVANDLISLATAREYGDARSQIVLSLPKTKDGRVPGILLDLIDDSSVAPSAIEALGKMKFKEARERIASLVEDPDENVRSQAKKALKRIHA